MFLDLLKSFRFPESIRLPAENQHGFVVEFREQIRFPTGPDSGTDRSQVGRGQHEQHP